MDVFEDFRTSDLYFAAYLSAAGLPFIESAKSGTRTYFVFENRDDLRALKNAYFSGKGEVSALGLSNAIRTMKRLCHMA